MQTAHVVKDTALHTHIQTQSYKPTQRTPMYSSGQVCPLGSHTPLDTGLQGINFQLLLQVPTP